MVMTQNRTTYDWQVRIRSNKIMRKLFYKGKQLYKGVVLNLHWNMLTVKYNTMLVIIYIWRILEPPLIALNLNGNDSVILSCRMIYSSCIALILNTKLALWISTLLCILSCRNRLRVFFRFGQIDCNIHLSVFCCSLPLHILLDTISSDVICILTERIIPVCCSLCTLFIIELLKGINNIRRSRNHTAHNFCIKQITIYNRIIFHKAICCCIIKHFL